MFCISCGKEISDTAKVCGYCGARQSVPKPPAPEPTPPPELETSVEEAVPAEEIFVPEASAPPEPAQTPSSAPQSQKRKGGIPVWVWVIVGLAIIIGVVLILGPKAPPPPAPEPTATIQVEDSQEEQPIVEQDAQVSEWELQFLSANEINDQVFDHYPNIRDLTEEIDLNRILVEGVEAVEGTSAVERQVYLHPSEPVRINMGWCEADWVKLDAAYQSIEIFYSFDGKEVEDQHIKELDFEFEGLSCRSSIFVVEEWAPGIYIIEIDWILTDDIYDSTLDVTIGAGELHISYEVYVEE